MKAYMKPVTTILAIHTEQLILAGSGGGVNNGDSVGNDYSSTDVTYSRTHSVWGDDEEDL